MRTNDLLTESSRAYLYHATTFWNVKDVLASNRLRAGGWTQPWREYSGSGPEEIKGISLSRNHLYSELYEAVVLVLDQEKLLQDGYKIYPYDYKAMAKNKSGHVPVTKDEFEEFIPGTIENLDRYLVSIYFSPKKMEFYKNQSSEIWNIVTNHPKYEAWLPFIHREKQINEDFLTAYNDSVTKNYVEIFVNPTEKELRSISNPKMDGSIRGFLTTDKLIVWDGSQSVHGLVAKQLGFSKNDALGIYLYYHPSDPNIGVTVTDYNVGGPWHHSPDTADWIREHPAIFVDPDYVQIDYYDDDIVGDWENLTAEDVDSDWEEEYSDEEREASRIALNEGRDAPLYHNMRIKKALSIFTADILPGTWEHLIDNKMQQGTSFTRNPRFARQIGAAFGPIMIEINQTKLAQRHKIIPLDAELIHAHTHDHKAGGEEDIIRSDKSWNKGHRDRILNKAHEQYAEEFVIGPINNLHTYIDKIFILDKSERRPYSPMKELVKIIKAYGKQHNIKVVDMYDKRQKKYKLTGPYASGAGATGIVVPAKR